MDLDSMLTDILGRLKAIEESLGGKDGVHAEIAKLRQSLCTAKRILIGSGAAIVGWIVGPENMPEWLSDIVKHL